MMSDRFIKKLRRLNLRAYPKHVFPPPSWLVLGVNRICNLRCRMCDIGSRSAETNFYKNTAGGELIHMPLDLFRQIVVSAARFFPSAKLGYAFTEPLIYDALDASLEIVGRYRRHSAITTNGFQLGEKAGVIVDAGVKEVFISLDGPEETHNHIRRHPEAFSRAVGGMESLFSYPKHPDVSVFCTITTWNAGRLKELADFLKPYPIRHLGFMHTNFTTRDAAERHNRIWGSRYPATHSNIELSQIQTLDLQALQHDIISVKSSDYPFEIGFSPDVATMEGLRRFYFEPDRLVGKICMDSASTMMIKPDGSVMPAHGRCFNIEVGNLYTSNLKAIWNSEKFGGFRRDLVKAGGLFPACARCCSAFSMG